MSRNTGSRAYSGRHRDPKVDEKSTSGHRRKPHRVVPPTDEQLVAWRVHCALRQAPGNYNPVTGSMPPGPYTAALAKLLEDT